MRIPVTGNLAIDRLTVKAAIALALALAQAAEAAEGLRRQVEGIRLGAMLHRQRLLLTRRVKQAVRQTVETLKDLAP